VVIISCSSAAEHLGPRFCNRAVVYLDITWKLELIAWSIALFDHWNTVITWWGGRAFDELFDHDSWRIW